MGMKELGAALSGLGQFGSMFQPPVKGGGSAAGLPAGVGGAMAGMGQAMGGGVQQTQNPFSQAGLDTGLFGTNLGKGWTFRTPTQQGLAGKGVLMGLRDQMSPLEQLLLMSKIGYYDARSDKTRSKTGRRSTGAETGITISDLKR